MSLEGLLRGVCDDFEAELVEFNGECDHVHLLVNFPPKVSISKLVNSLKGVSSRRLKQLHPELVKPAYMKNALWSPSYYAGSVGGAPISVIRQYIEQQTRPQ
jgi:putative transposase